MRLNIQFQSATNQQIEIPLQYNHLVQAIIYNSLDPEFAEFLHSHGYNGEGRTFKLFCFSRLIGKYQIMGPKIKFYSPVQLIVTSPVERFCQSLLNGLLTKTEFHLADATVGIESIKAEIPKVESEMIRFKLLSPAVVYSTLIKADGNKYTCYFQPGEREFTEKAAENLRKKYQAIYNTPAPSGELQIRPFRQPKLHVMEYKGNVIKGYSGMLEMKGPRELLQVAVDAGLGSKNSMGFGCGEKCREK